MNPNSPELLRLVPDVGHKSGAGAQAHAVTRQPPVSMVSRNYCSRGLGVRRRLVPEGERRCVDTIGAKSQLGITLAGRQHCSATPCQHLRPHSDAGDTLVPSVQGAVVREVTDLEDWDGISSPCPAQAACCPRGELSTVPTAVAGWPKAMGLKDGDRGHGPHGQQEG